MAIVRASGFVLSQTWTTKIGNDGKIYGQNESGGTELRFTTFSRLNTDTQKLTTWLAYSPRPNEYYTAAYLDDNGNWVPLKNKESQKLNYENFGDLDPVDAQASSQPGANNYVLGTGAIRSLTSRNNPPTLKSISIENAKKTLASLPSISNQQVNNLFLKNFKIGTASAPNGQKPDGNSDQDGNQDQSIDLGLRGLAAGTPVANSRNEIGTYAIPGASLVRYPENLSNSQDQLKIKIYASKPRNINTETENATSFYDTRSRDRIRIGQELGGVILPAPGAIRDSNRVNWGGKEDNAIALDLADKAKTFIGGGGFNLTEFKNRYKTQSKDLKTAASVYFSEQATGVSGLLARTSGGILNPNLELLFQGPTLRPFNFTYKLSPRSPEEAKRALIIIRMFKQSMAVQRTTSNLFLRSPNLYRLSFVDGRRNTNANKGGDNPHKYLPRIKECALLSFNVNYTPDGTYATHWDSSMVSYELSFEFQELEPIFNDDYSELSNDETSPDYSIGY